MQDNTKAQHVFIGRQTDKSNNTDIIGIVRQVSCAVNPDDKYSRDWFQLEQPQETFLAECARLSHIFRDPSSSRVSNVNIVEYYEGDTLKREIFHVLHVIPSAAYLALKY